MVTCLFPVCRGCNRYSVPFFVDRRCTRDQHGHHMRVGSGGGVLNMSLSAMQPPPSAEARSSSSILLEVHANEESTLPATAASGTANATTTSTTNSNGAFETTAAAAAAAAAVTATGSGVEADDAALLAVSALGSPRGVAGGSATKKKGTPSGRSPPGVTGASHGFGSSIGVGGRRIFQDERQRQQAYGDGDRYDGSSAAPQQANGGSATAIDDTDSNRAHFFLGTCQPDLFQEVARARCSMQVLSGVLNEIHPVKRYPASAHRGTSRPDAQIASSSRDRDLEMRLARFCVLNCPAAQTLAVLTPAEARALAATVATLDSASGVPLGMDVGEVDRSSAPLQSYLSSVHGMDVDRFVCRPPKRRAGVSATNNSVVVVAVVVVMKVVVVVCFVCT